MKAVCLKSKEAKDLAVVDVEVPEPGAGQVRVKVEAVGICGSDVSCVMGKANFDWVERPRILGHEYAGTVDAVGEGVDGFEAGQAVTSLAVQGCTDLDCEPCRTGNTQRCLKRRILGFHMEGAMAEYVLVEARHVMPLREGLGFVEGALVEPVSVASRHVLKGCEVEPGMRVVVSGCGIIGMLCALLARACGAEVTVSGAEWDREVRLTKAAELGFGTVAVSEGASLASQLDGPADCLIEASGAPPALSASVDAVKWGGTIGVVATYPVEIEMPMTKVVRGEQRLQGTMASAWDDFEAAMRHLEEGVIPVGGVVDEFELEDAVAAFEGSIDKSVMKGVLRTSC
ncbi:MAG: alcohol dehydrogenase catalytic domain-containing protein [Verrucomicrobiota bacterium]